ncbi:MAG: tetrahydromethanopterin S-methyltransferase subunit B [Methanobacteriaceae archaeon]|nr:tetrahydromethanopterin S-methyltransferase subunit B [Methanobacteriaceae archaeon]
MEILPLVKVVPEMNLTIDPSTGMVGAAVGGAVIVSMDGVNEQLNELEVAVEDLYTALDPTTVSEGSYPGREGTYLLSGTLTNMVYGFILGLVLLLAILL